MFVQDADMAALLRSLRVHGQGLRQVRQRPHRLNARMDTILAAILLEMLAIFPDEIEARDRIAARYAEGLAGVCTPPAVAEGSTSVWAQYTIRIGDRDGVAARLRERGIPTAIYYPKPLHRQTAYRDFPVAGGVLPVSDRLADEVLSLPMHPYLEPDLQDRIIAEVIAAAG
ncbi:MAG: DegT/DnrJ/EryC1/StrS family aminotransferase [Caulobacteraceae bacterium]